MLWKQFFTPVQSLVAEQAQKLLSETPFADIILLDVRQPKEYRAGHLPGAKLLPMPELQSRLAEINSEKTILVYWAVGARSRVAAQMLTAHGFPHVYNLTGGIKGWHGATAFGEEDQGLELFSGSESADKSLIVAYALEQGLCEFYLSMIHKVEKEQIRALFTKLANIEIQHQDRIFAEYLRITGITIDKQDFEKMTVVKAMEGGMTTEEYISRLQPNFEAAAEVIGLAMGIEAQALDLYHRASQHTTDKECRRILSQIATEEQTHLHLLGQLMEQI